MKSHLIVRAAVYCLLGGLPVGVGALGAPGFGAFWLSGVVMAAAFLPVALRGPGSRRAQLAVILPVVWIVTALCTWSEALLFMPDSPIARDPAGTLVGVMVVFSLVALALALLGPALKLRQSEGVAVAKRKPLGVGLMVLLSGLSYVFYYFVTGSLVFELFTRDYYPEAVSQVQALGIWFWVVQFARGAAMALAVVPLVYTLRMSRRNTALVTGLVIWVTGGLAPLLMPNELMGSMQRFIHIVEILTQNAPLGMTAAWLLRPREGTDIPRTNSMQAARAS